MDSATESSNISKPISKSASDLWVEGTKIVKNITDPNLPEHYDNQKKFLAALRGLVQVFSVYWQPGFAMVGVILTALFLEKCRHFTRAADGMLTGLWNAMDPKHLLVVVPVGIVFAVSGYYFIQIPIFTGVFNAVASVFALKVASELTQRNFKRQIVNPEKDD